MSLQTRIAKLLLKLPPAWLVRLSGGAPIMIGGRTMDPHMQFVVHGASRQPGLSTLSPEEARRVSDEAIAALAPPPEPGVASRDFMLKAPKREIPVRLYQPGTQDPARPLMVYLHMGGGVIGGLETSHAFCALLASRTRAPVLSVDYRLAPEHKFPAGLEDGLFAYEWALRHAAEFGAPAGEASVGGDSMGGNFAAVIAQEMRRNDMPLPSLQLMIYPATDLARDYPSRTLFGDVYPLQTKTMDWFMAHYLHEEDDRADPRISPCQEPRLDGLPPAIIVTAGFDPLVDEGAAYARHLEEAGVPVDHSCHDSLVHGFTAFMGVSPAARAACEDIAARVARAYAEGIRDAAP